MSPFELGLLLRERGWEWRLLPVAVKDRRDLAHDASLPVGVWYTLGKILIRGYLLCLLTCTELHAQHAIVDIPHYRRKPTDYTRLKDGKPLEPELDPPPRQKLRPLADDTSIDATIAIEDCPQPKRQRVSEPAATEDEEAAEEADDLDDDQGLDPFIDSDLEADLMALQQEQLQLEAEARRLAELQQEQLQLEAEARRLAEEAASVDEGGIVGLDDVEDGGGSDIQEHRRGRLTLIKWGSCSIARRTVEGNRKAFEARCVYHRLNSDSGCRKTIAFDGDQDEAVVKPVIGG